jgi:hypothetical protein
MSSDIYILETSDGGIELEIGGTILEPGNLISFQPVPSQSWSPTSSACGAIISYGTEYAEVKWILSNTIGLFVKISPDDRKKAICLFGDQLFIVPITSIEPIGDCNV